MKLTKARLQQIIREEIEKIEEESDPAVTEFELYSDLLEITKQLDEFSSNLNVAMGLTASATKQSQLPDEVYETIRSAIRGLDDARIKMAQAIGQDPAPELAQVR
jgi:methionine synthase II (cobalamin-independent)